MSLRVYLDTSVFSACFDERVPDRRVATEEFWTRLGEFDVSTSELARAELSQASDLVLRERLLGLLQGVTILPLSDEMRALAHDYVKAGVFGAAMFNDALHVAAAVMARQDVLVSWNFKHLVNRRKRSQIGQQNVSLGLPSIEILAPPEL